MVDSDTCQQIESSLEEIFGQSDCLMAPDLVAVTDLERNILFREEKFDLENPVDNVNFAASYQICFRTEVAESESDEAAIANAKQIFGQSFEWCKLDPLCLVSVENVIVLPEDVTEQAESLAEYTETDTILWKANDVLTLSSTFKLWLFQSGSGCEIDCYNPNCEICELELELENVASSLGTVPRSIVALEYITTDMQIDQVNFQVEFETHENTKAKVEQIYKTWLGDIPASNFLSGRQSSDAGYIGVVKNPSSIFWETWKAKDFIDTTIDGAERKCFEEAKCDPDTECDPSSECKLQIEENLNRVWAEKENDQCLAKEYRLNVIDKDTNYIFCMEEHKCPFCNTECTLTLDDQYRAEYDIEFMIRTHNHPDEQKTRQRFLIMG